VHFVFWDNLNNFVYVQIVRPSYLNILHSYTYDIVLIITDLNWFELIPILNYIIDRSIRDCLIRLEIVWFDSRLFNSIGDCLIRFDLVWFDWRLFDSIWDCLIRLEIVWFDWRLFDSIWDCLIRFEIVWFDLSTSWMIVWWEALLWSFWIKLWYISIDSCSTRFRWRLLCFWRRAFDYATVRLQCDLVTRMLYRHILYDLMWYNYSIRVTISHWSNLCHFYQSVSYNNKIFNYFSPPNIWGHCGQSLPMYLLITS